MLNKITMNKRTQKLLLWAPRILGILFAGFLSLFATDVFGEYQGFWKTFLAFMIHLIPTWMVLITLAVSWRREWVGGIMFIVLGVGYLILSWGKFNWAVYLVISGPLFLISVLFLINWFYRLKLRTDT